MSNVTAVLKALEHDRKRAQKNLYQKFMSSEMTVAQYEKSAEIIDRRYAREQAIVLAKAILNNR